MQGETAHQKKQEKTAQGTKTPDYPESPAPPHSEAPQQQLEQLSFLTPASHLIDSYLLQWISWNLHLSESVSYPKHETPISTPEGSTTISVAERRKWKRE